MKKIFSALFLSLLSAVSFAQTPITFTVTEANNELPSDVTELTLKLYPTNFGPETDVTFSNTLADVTITNSQNEAVATGTLVTAVEKVAGTKCDFKLTINNTAIAAAIKAAMESSVSYLVSFKEGSLSCTVNGTAYNNKKAVAAYVNFWDAVDFSIDPATSWKVCGNEVGSLPIKIKAEGHHGKISYDDKVSLATPAVPAKITGKDIAGNDVSVDATIAGSNGAYTLTPAAVLPQDNGTAYTVTIPAGALKASKSENKEMKAEKKLDVLSHVTFAYVVEAYTDNKVDERNEFGLKVSAKVDATKKETIEKELVAVVGKTFQVKKDGAVVTTGVITMKGVPSFQAGRSISYTELYVKTAEVLAPGSYQFVFEAGAFTANLDKTDATFAIPVEIVAVKWTYTPESISVHDQETKVKFTVKAEWDGKTQKITTVKPTVTLGTNASAQLVETKADTTYVYEVTFNPISADTKLTIAKNALTLDGNFVTKNAVQEIPVKVVPYVFFSTNKTPILRSTADKVFKFTIDTKDKNGATLVRNLEYKGKVLVLNEDGTVKSTPAVNEAIALNNGFQSVFPTSVVCNGNEVTLTFNQSFEGGNYQLNIPEKTIYAESNTNDNLNKNGNGKLFVNFQILNEIQFSLEPAKTDISTNDTQATITLKGKDVVDNMDATVNITYSNPALKLSNGNAVTTAVEKNVINATFAALAEGTYTITIPAGSVKANASENKDLVYTVNVEDFEVRASKINEQTTKFDVQVSDEAVTVLEGAKATVNGVAVELSNSAKAGYVTVTMPTILGKGTYDVVVEKSAFKGTYATLYKTIKGTVVVIREFTFNDAVGGDVKTTTRNDIVVDTQDSTKKVAGSKFDELHYARTFNSTSLQAISLPFNVKAGDVKEGFTILRINAAIKSGSENVTFYCSPLNDNEIAYANKPYMIKAVKTGKYEVTLKDVEVVEPAKGEVECSTTKNIYKFVGNVERTKAAGKWIMKGGLLTNITTTSSTMLADWRWEMLTSDKDIQYANVVIEDEEQVNSIETIEFNNDAEIFNLAGQEMNAPVKGINIINGKKVIIK